MHCFAVFILKHRTTFKLWSGTTISSTTTCAVVKHTSIIVRQHRHRLDVHVTKPTNINSEEEVTETQYCDIFLRWPPDSILTILITSPRYIHSKRRYAFQYTLTTSATSAAMPVYSDDEMSVSLSLN